jgi:hypothetical protein
MGPIRHHEDASPGREEMEGVGVLGEQTKRGRKARTAKMMMRLFHSRIQFEFTKKIKDRGIDRWRRVKHSFFHNSSFCV